MKAPSAGNIAALSSSMFARLLDSFDQYAKGGKSNLIMSYGSTIWMNDFLWSAGLISDQAYQDTRIIADIFSALAGAESLITSVFGGTSPFAPSLNTLSEAAPSKSKPNGSGKDDEDDDEEDLLKALNVQSIAALLPKVATALG